MSTHIHIYSAARHGTRDENEAEQRKRADIAEREKGIAARKRLLAEMEAGVKPSWAKEHQWKKPEGKRSIFEYERNILRSMERELAVMKSVQTATLKSSTEWYKALRAAGY